jgi:tetratricopeptide (TPR) repeat protein
MGEILTEKHMQETSGVINDYKKNNRWLDAKRVLEEELIIYPNEYWLLTTLSNVLYELKDYNSALEYSEKALNAEPSDYLVLNNHACILSVIEGKEKDAIELLERIIFTDSNKIEFGNHGEGMRWAKSLVNDCRVRLALVYLSINEKAKAIEYLNEHLEKREKGVFSNFSRKDIIKRKSAIK